MKKNFNCNTKVYNPAKNSFRRYHNYNLHMQGFSPKDKVLMTKYALGFCCLGLAGYGIYKGTGITFTKGDLSVKIGSKPQTDKVDNIS